MARITREDKRIVYYTQKELERMEASERTLMLNALNIDPASLAPLSEAEIRSQQSTKEAAKIMVKFH